MKNIFKYLAVAALGIALTGFVACEPDPEPEPTPTPTPEPEPEPEQYTESSTLTIKYEGNAVAAGDTAVYNNNNSVIPMMVFEVVNKTHTGFDAYFKVEMLEGPESMGSMGFCTDVCNNFICPFVAPRPNRPFTIPANGSNTFDLQFMGGEGSRALYKMTAGKGEDLQDPQIIFLRVNI